MAGDFLPDEPAKSEPPVESAIAAAPEAPPDAATGTKAKTDAGEQDAALSADVPAGDPAPEAEAQRMGPGAGSKEDATASVPEWLASLAVSASGQTGGAVTAAPVRDTAGAESAVRAYCAELFNTPHSGQVADEILATTDLANTPADELLQATARLAADHESAALVRPGWRGLRSAKRVDCHSTPGWLASRAGGDLGAVEEEELEEHLRSCLPCQAAELRAARAERAFATALAGGGVGVRESSGPPNVGMGESSGPPNLGVDESPVPPNLGVDESPVPPNVGWTKVRGP